MVFRALTPVGRFREDPFDVLRQTMRHLDSYWPSTPAANTTGEAAALSVRLDVKEDDKAYYVSADLPGLSEKDVEVTFDDSRLTIRGEKKVERDDKKDIWHIVERSYGSFARQMTLPVNVDADKIDAKFEKGVLTIVLPKLPAEQNAAKKITIKAA
jgi:HSP20 family protein